MLSVYAPSGADMSMHTYLAQLLITADGIPASYLPLVNIDSFDTFPVGFHVLSALVSLLGNVEAYRATFILTCLTYSLLTYSIYLLLRVTPYFDWRIALFTTLWFTFLTNAPQEFVSWGGNPTVLALVFVILFISVFLKIESHNSGYILIAAFFLAAVLLTHTIIFVQAFYLLIPSFLLYTWIAKKLNQQYILSTLAVICLFLIVVSPYLLNINFDVVTPSVTGWIKNWVRNASHVWRGSITDFYWSIPVYIYDQIFFRNLSRTLLTVCISIYGLIVLSKEKKELSFLHGSLFLMCILLVLNTQYWILPLSYLIYPERTAIMVIIPSVAFFSVGLYRFILMIQHRVPLPVSIHNLGILVLIILVAMICIRYNHSKYVWQITRDSSVTADDMKGFAWLREHSSDLDIIETNYGDGGQWIPAIIHRQGTGTHINLLYLERVKNPESIPRYAFIGSKCVYRNACSHTYEAYAHNDAYNLVFRSNQTFIFQLK
jgi:hypothetical protein